jgi:CheY-like chemotaxis protein
VRSAGYETILVNSGPAALQAVQNATPDLILCDIGMPEMDGFETLEHLRRDKRFQQVNVVALTAYATLKDKEQILKQGFNEYISKPFKRDQLLNVLERMMKP